MSDVPLVLWLLPAAVAMILQSGAVLHHVMSWLDRRRASRLCAPSLFASADPYREPAPTESPCSDADRLDYEKIGRSAARHAANTAAYQAKYMATVDACEAKKAHLVNLHVISTELASKPATEDTVRVLGLILEMVNRVSSADLDSGAAKKAHLSDLRVIISELVASAAAARRRAVKPTPDTVRVQRMVFEMMKRV